MKLSQSQKKRRAAMRKKWLKNNKERVRSYIRKWRAKNKERVKKVAREYYWRNRPKQLKRRRLYYKKYKTTYNRKYNKSDRVTILRANLYSPAKRIKYKNVYYDKRRANKPYRIQFGIDGKDVFCGSYASETAAVKVAAKLRAYLKVKPPGAMPKKSYSAEEIEKILLEHRRKVNAQKKHYAKMMKKYNYGEA